MATNDPKDYWDKNIDSWGKFYLESSHPDEEFNSPRWLTALYRRFIVPIEARLMAERYKLTIDFINNYIGPGMTVADIGCGTGIFAVEILKRGASVVCIDISSSSLETTKKNIRQHVPGHEAFAQYLQLDVSKDLIPKVDIAIAIGVTPYVTKIEPFYQNILGRTRVFYCLILDPKHWANMTRAALPILNVRNMHCFSRETIDKILERNRYALIERRDFSSGYLDIVKSKE